MENTFRRVFLVSGGSEGIGTVIVKSLLAEECCVSVGSRDPKKLEKIFGKENKHLQFVEYDPQDEDAAKEWVKLALERFTYISDLCIMHGSSARIHFMDKNVKGFKGDFDVNVVAPWLLMQECLPYLEDTAKTRGLVPNIFVAGSLSGVAARTPGSVSYGVSKAGLHILTQMLGALCANNGNLVRVVLLVLDPVKTGMSHRSTLSDEDKIQAEDVAGQVLHSMNARRGAMYQCIALGTKYDMRF